MRRPNIILIVIDALRAKNLGCYGHHRKTSPNIDKIAENGILFERAYACTNHTDPSFTTISTGLYPISHGIIHHGMDVKEEEIIDFYNVSPISLPQILRKNGYNTFAISWLRRWHKRGYDFYGESIDTSIRAKNKKLDLFLKELGKIFVKLPLPIYNRIKKIWRKVGLSQPTRNGSIVTELAMKLIKNRTKENFFILLHYTDVHYPYITLPKEYRYKFLEDKNSDHKTPINILNSKIKNKKWREKVIKCFLEGIEYIEDIYSIYDGAINYVDNEIGRLIDFLKKEREYDKTIFIITSDHGDGLIWDEIFIAHCGLYEPIINVPLIIYGKNLPKNVKIKNFVQHVDLAPTILELVGIDPKPYNFDGMSFLNMIYNKHNRIRNEIFAVEATIDNRFAIRDNNYKYISSINGKIESKYKIGVRDVEELYYLVTDPKEEYNIAHEKKDIAKEYKRKLLIWIKNLNLKKKERIKIRKISKIRKYR